MSGDVKGQVVLGRDVFNGEVVHFRVRNGGSVLCVASPRYGKGALCKNFIVQVSKFKRVCVFDYRGEWVEQVTKENLLSDYPDAVSDYFVAENFAFPITTFDKFGDWIGFGFDDSAANFMTKVVRSSYHGGELEKVREMIRALPKNDSEVADFNEKYGTDLLVGIHGMSKDALGRRFEVVQRFFWKGGEDLRQVLDFAGLSRQYRHLLIDLSDRRDGFKDMGKARAYAGIIGRELDVEGKQWFFVVEEASQLLAPLKELPDGTTVGYSEFHRLVERWLTLNPKHGVNVLLLCQSRKQLYQPLLVYLPVVWMGRLNPVDVENEHERMLNDALLPVTATVRKWWLLDGFYGMKSLFLAALPCCQYETNY